VAFVALAMLLCLPPVRVALMPRAARPRRGLSGATTSRGPWHRAQKDRAGILIFVSLAERYARIIATRASRAAWRRLNGRRRRCPDRAHARRPDLEASSRRSSAVKRAGDALSVSRGEPRRAADRIYLSDRIVHAQPDFSHGLRPCW